MTETSIHCGLDSSFDVGMGLAWAPTRDLELSLLRTNVQDDVEVAAKYAVLQQAPSIPLSISARAGVDWRTERGLDDRTTGFAQLVLSRQLNRKFEVFAIPSFASNAGAFDEVFNVPLGAAWAMKPYLSLIVELIPENSDLPDDRQSDFGWAIGIKRAIGGHYFEILLTDSRATHVDQYLGGTFLGGTDDGDVHLGFNIERRFGR